MTQRQTITGFFDNVAEAQQAVQLLLGQGFTPENVSLSAPAGLNPATGDRLTAPARADNRSGRFFDSLFGNGDAAEEKVAHRSGTQVTVQVQSTTKAEQVAELLDAAGAGAVERPEPNR